RRRSDSRRRAAARPSRAPPACEERQELRFPPRRRPRRPLRCHPRPLLYSTQTTRGGLADDPDKLARTGMHHTAFEFPTLDGLLDTYVRLKGEGILPHACLDHGMTISLYYVDPDGNSVELQADAFGDWARSSAFLSTDSFVGNPIGMPFDPDQMVAARDAGADAAELHRRTYAGEFPSAEPLDLRFPLG